MKLDNGKVITNNFLILKT